MIETPSFLMLCAVTGLLGLDATAALQLMLSRPLVVGALVGALLGDMATGATVGGLIELVWIAGVPVGSLVPPDGTLAAALAAVIAVRLSAASAHPGAATAAASLAILFAIPAAWLGARAEILQRLAANRLSHRADAAAAAGDLGGLGGLMAAALALAWLRGALAMALCLVLLYPLAAALLPSLPADAIQALDWSFWLFWLLGLAVAADHFWDRKGLKYAGLLLLLLALAASRPGMTQARSLGALVVVVHLLGLWRWWRALRGEATA